MTPITDSTSRPLEGPYRERSTNLIYHLLFCDRLDLFEASYEGDRTGPWMTLFETIPNLDSVARIAGDKAQESRFRALAFGLLRAGKKVVEAKELLGTIIEVRLPDGLDTLAVFADGGARYINQSEKIVVVEGTPNPFQDEINEVIKASLPIVAAIGPWDQDRLPAPGPGNVRMTFLVSDGLYFGEGPFSLMLQEPMAAPLLQAATLLLQKLITTANNSEQAQHS